MILPPRTTRIRSATDRGKPVGDEEGGAAPKQGFDGVLDELLGEGIDGGGRLVQHEDVRVGQDCPGEGQKLLLSVESRSPLSPTSLS